ncbi:hypothetical protein ACH5RR_033701, partial [Cinchona calisaya]
ILRAISVHQFCPIVPFHVATTIGCWLAGSPPVQQKSSATPSSILNPKNIETKIHQSSPSPDLIINYFKVKAVPSSLVDPSPFHPKNLFNSIIISDKHITLSVSQLH